VVQVYLLENVLLESGLKSGCNQSNDGPGYGEYVKNPKAKLSCSTSTDGGTGNCMPVVKATFTADSKSVTATSTKALNNVVLKYYDGQEQKFANVNGKISYPNRGQE
jgi:hypothetical protein